MSNKKKILAISGSTRANSTNLNLIKAIIDLTTSIFTINIFEGLSEIPHFNPDLDNENPPGEVVQFRKQLNEADGILICTPEYAMGVPGTLKNAIDWTVSSCEFSNKPTALITASSVGQKGHASLLETLKIIEAKMTQETQLVISFVKTKINNECKITDDKTLFEVNTLITAFETILAYV
jgi:chromate reductase, NAD(P)H dehydrogenase (quinone)